MNRATMLSAVDDLVDIAKKEDQDFIFFVPKKPTLREEEIMQSEFDLLGYYVTKHPLDACSTRINDLTKISDLPKHNAESSVSVGGILAEIKHIKTKKGKEMAFLQLEDLTGRVEVVVFPGSYTKCKDMLQSNAIVEVSGKLELEESEGPEGEVIYNPKILMYKIKPLEKIGKINRLVISITKNDNLESINKKLNEYPGDIPVFLEYNNLSIALKEGFAHSTKALTELEKLCMLKEIKE